MHAVTHNYSVQIFVIGLIIECKKGLFPDLRHYIHICIHYHIYVGMQLHLEVISTVYIMYTYIYIHIFTLSIIKDTSLSEISIHLFTLPKILH